ncbi:MAG: ketoacyl-ACP synthase III [Myxococcales bacterium]|nr:ketoacyl-ACP synthase III [Myxococcales bacterium]
MTTETLIRQAMPERDPVDMARRIGIDARHFADPGDTVAEIGAALLRTALDQAGWAPHTLQRLILVNSHGGDHPIPATANAVLEAAGIRHTCGAFDLNNACTGFVTALDLAARLVATGLERVAVLTVELLSKWIDASQPRALVVLGDAGAACLVEAGPPGAGLLAADFGNDGEKLPSVTLQHGVAERITFGVPGRAFFDYALEGMLRSAQTVLTQAALDSTEVDWFVLHQPNGALFDRFLEVLAIPPERTVRLVDRIGSVGAASAACGLAELRATRPLRPGQTVLFVAVGAGASRGALLWRL